ncbi:MAG: cyclic nucleotide-binding domain-containing protein [Rhodospirillum sp.]|nr:cyclic nucleotide-binding domain-containing protein [Rhodospirillum sp.]MCF8489350.1 cyclic nucleotide-binding domain-containing protein [Rhodospirillum sp.]MCF8500706.1 cyclic nucleotide-binding domain-containing protein [Rhodospirillum sp.]
MGTGRDRILERKLYPAGKVVFSQGERGDAAYVIESGAVAISLTDEKGKTIRLGLLRKGALFGEMAVIDGGQRMASAIVEEGAVLVRIPGDQMRGKMDKIDPFIRAVLKMLLDNLRGAHGVRPPAQTLEQHVEVLGQAVANIKAHCGVIGSLDGDPDFHELLKRQDSVLKDFRAFALVQGIPLD